MSTKILSGKLCFFTWASLLVMLSSRASAQLVTGDQADVLYRSIKSLEAYFPTPPAFDTLTVVILDARTGRTSGAGTFPRLPFPWLARTAPPKPVNAKIGDKTANADLTPLEFDADRVPEITINAIDVGVRFVVENATTPFSVVVNGTKVVPSAGQTAVMVNIKDAKQVDWSIQYGTRRAFGTFTVRRSPWPLAGAFTIPALPVAILYEPPMDHAKQNKTMMTGQSQVGTSVTTSFSSVDHGGKQAMPTGFEDVEAFKADARMVSDGLGVVVQAGGMAANASGDPVAMTAAKTAQQVSDGLKKVVGALDDLLGKASASQQIDRTSLHEHRLDISSGTSVGDVTNAFLGPGLGDNITYLRDVRFVYLGAGDKFAVTPVGYRREVSRSVAQLRSDLDSIQNKAGGNSAALDTLRGPNSGLTRKSIEALLTIDPFVAGGQAASLDPKRFLSEEEFEVNGKCRDETVWQSTSQADKDGSITTTSYVEDLQKGMLAFLGLGVTESVHINNATTESSSTERTKGHTQSAGLHLCADATEDYAVDIFYDRVYGTFAVRLAPTIVEPVISGTLVDANGVAKPHERIVVNAGGRQYVTFSDANGRYALRGANIPLGAATLTAAGHQQAVHLQRRALPTEVRVP